MWVADANPNDIHNFGMLEELVQISVPAFKAGEKTRSGVEMVVVGAYSDRISRVNRIRVTCSHQAAATHTKLAHAT